MKSLTFSSMHVQTNLLMHLRNFHLIIKNYHSQLAQAQRVFHQFARGPACEKYLKQLEQSCEKFWRNGRQLCEEVSILSNHCVNPVSQNYSYSKVEISFLFYSEKKWYEFRWIVCRCHWKYLKFGFKNCWSFLRFQDKWY